MAKGKQSLEQLIEGILSGSIDLEEGERLHLTLTVPPLKEIEFPQNCAPCMGPIHKIKNMKVHYRKTSMDDRTEWKADFKLNVPCCKEHFKNEDMLTKFELGAIGLGMKKKVILHAYTPSAEWAREFMKANLPRVVNIQLVRSGKGCFAVLLSLLFLSLSSLIVALVA